MLISFIEDNEVIQIKPLSHRKSGCDHNWYIAKKRWSKGEDINSYAHNFFEITFETSKVIYVTYAVMLYCIPGLL